MSPPVLMVKPERGTDVENSTATATSSDAAIDDRRKSNEVNRQRMRVGLCGLLTSTDRTRTITVLYSMNAKRLAGRLRVMDPMSVWPLWLGPGSRLWLSDYDGVSLRIRITTVKSQREGDDDDELFAEFVVPPLAH